MRSAYQSSSYRAPASLRSRAVASALSMALLAAIILALLWVTSAPRRELSDGASLETFDVASATRAPSPSAPAKPVQRPKTPPPAAAKTPPPPPVRIPPLPGLVTISRADFAASDIGAKRSADAPAATGTEVADSGGGGAVYGPSEVPGGKTLHNADWYREPTRAEMATYMPPRQQLGWGMIACRTVERFRVEDCRELGESPGSGISRGMRRAAWQFLIRPPQIDGKPQIGSWVRIRFDMIEGIVK